MSDLPPSSPPSSSDDGGDEVVESGLHTRHTVPQHIVQINRPTYGSNKGLAARGHIRGSVSSYPFLICPAYFFIHVVQELLGSVPEMWRSHVQRSAM